MKTFFALYLTISFGFAAEKTVDEELQYYKNELNNIKTLNSTYLKKAELLDELNSQTNTLKENFNQYADKKKDFETRVDTYNQQQTCFEKTGKINCDFQTLTEQEGQKEVNKKNFKQAFNQIILNNKDKFNDCYQSQVAEDSKLKGNVEFRFTFLPTGGLEHIGIVENMNKQNRKLIRCVYTILNRIQYPQTGHENNITISKVFKFSKKSSTY
ncbi:AgmX/PglI C-terminal domain-containing protein [Bacteriovoracaceae bacterium]|nr:AgmX/PglI C-terminal domain-containing protein [Bacteriovoracaceae bacterium]